MTEHATKYVAPLCFVGDRQATQQRLVALLVGLERTKIIAIESEYIHAEFVTKVFKFTDDVEFLLDEGKRLVHVRSASRKGIYDFGVNRRRVEALRAIWERQ